MYVAQGTKLELARIGSQLFVYDSATRDQTAAPPLFDTFATRLSAQPLSTNRLIPRGVSSWAKEEPMNPIRIPGERVRWC
jgi:hypothetical protein